MAEEENKTEQEKFNEIKNRHEEKKDKEKKELHITLLDKSYVKPRGRGGEPYGEYVKGIKDNDILSWIQEEISQSEDGRIIALLSDFAEAIGMKLKTTKYSKGKKPHSIYWGSKYALYILGNYIVNLGTSINDEPLLLIHEAPEDYELPTSLLKKIEQEMEEEVIEETEEDKKTEEEKEEEKTEKLESKILSLSEKRAIARKD